MCVFAVVFAVAVLVVVATVSRVAVVATLLPIAEGDLLHSCYFRIAAVGDDGRLERCSARGAVISICVVGERKPAYQVRPAPLEGRRSCECQYRGRRYSVCRDGDLGWSAYQK